MPPLLPWQWTLGAVCALFVGIAKSGVPGFGIAVVPLMVLAVGSARTSPGWLLPMLCTADLFAIAYYRRHAYARRLFNLAPWVLVGMGAGTVALGWGEKVMRPIIGAVVLTMIAAHLWRKWRRQTAVPTDWSHSARYGVLAGFATTVANAAGPVMNVYLLSKQLPKEEFVAAAAWFFFLVNLTKLPIYAWRGMISGPSLLFDLCLVPVVGLGALVGRRIVKRVAQSTFELAVLGLTATATLLLFLPH
ncbi:MAG TPA: sulfite exporter TauE/SafE family protein [Polyangia bacterium]|jgi:hypothetical protein|nr:sulfite exporter TauE/SafE family protein [Polyangia bacterium]